MNARLRFPVLVLVVLATAFPGCRQNRPPTATRPSTQPGVPIVAKYTGHIYTLAIDDATTQEVILDSPVVVRDAQAYQAFISRIPGREIEKTNPPRPSNDPLLKKPPIDFRKHMLVAVIRAESMYLPPDIASVRPAGDSIEVAVVEEELGELAGLQEARGVGTYCAVVVPRHDGAITVVKKRVPPATQAGESTLSEGSWRLAIQAAKTVEEFRQAAVKRFSEIPARGVVRSAALKAKGALGSGWTLSDTSESQGGGPVEFIFVAQESVLRVAGTEEVVALLRVFSSADAARQWAIDRAFSGAAPTDYLLARAKKHLLGARRLGDVSLSAELFVRDNVVVEYGSSLDEEKAWLVSVKLDQALVAIAEPSATRPAARPGAAGGP